ncbi:MAG: hypothetical protein QNJ34_06575 [Xenococcaceae cyanobacterium MO_188.B29]|nr:hypothetical protein [Xenococcaceae cyanobacterium MO_188.B29]
MKTAILTPLQKELTILVAKLEQLGLRKSLFRLGCMEIFEFSEVNLLVTCGGHGKTQFGIQAQYLLCQDPQIELLVCAGACGALFNGKQRRDTTKKSKAEYNSTLLMTKNK